MLNQIIFGYFAVTMISLALIVITRKNIMHSIVYMLILFFHIAGLYLFLNAEFLAAIQIIVYAGAIMVLFLFVIMLLNLREELRKSRFAITWPIGAIFVVLSAVMIIISVFGNRFANVGNVKISDIEKVGHTVAVGKLLFVEYLFPFEVASLILLVAIVGAIVLAKKEIK
ncbi:MAG: NADH-quinone oxidoreductase subunit J [Candidatus Magnetoovum sp. WYHC-5]|nr:NADH-quinone oxidoreductase subunit J [Candidatus Magnetoovum sp. WYHC-5]